MTDGRRRRGRRSSFVVAFAVVVSAGPLTSWAQASNWIAGLAAGSRGQAQSLTIGTPSNVASACPSPFTSKNVRVSWTGIAHATVTVYQSSTSATSGYSTVATGLTGTSWTSATLANGSYWFEVAANYGNNWTSAPSGATGPRKISSTTPVCS